MRDKCSVRGGKMSVVDAGIAEVRRKGLFILEWEFRGPGDTIEAASHRAEQKFGVPASFLQRLRSRNLTDALYSNCIRVSNAYDILCGQIERSAQHQQDIAKDAPQNAISSRLLKMAARLGGPEGKRPVDAAGGEP